VAWRASFSVAQGEKVKKAARTAMASPLYMGPPSDACHGDAEASQDDDRDFEAGGPVSAILHKRLCARGVIVAVAVTSMLVLVLRGWSPFRQSHAPPLAEEGLPVEAKALSEETIVLEDVSVVMPSPEAIFNPALRAAPFFAPGVLHGPHHLIHDCMLYQDPVPNSTHLGIQGRGTQLFPIKSEEEWVQVVVLPSSKVPDAKFGWMYVRDNVASLLKKDSKLKYQRPKPPPMTQEDVDRALSDYRAERARVQDQLLAIEEKLEHPKEVEGMTKDNSEMRRQIMKSAKKALDMKAMRERLKEMSKSLHQELGKDPQSMLDELLGVIK